MANTEQEYIQELASSIAKALDADWTRSGMGQIEEVKETQLLIIECLSTVIAILINKKALNIDILRSALSNGFLLKEKEKEENEEKT